jgi:rod shape-determining protein MreD
MLAPLALLLLVGLALLYFQNLILHPYVQVRLLSLLTFAAALRQPLAVAVGVAVFLGLLQDAFALTPMGLHLAGAVLLVAAARFLSRRLLLAGPGAQIVAVALVLLLEEVGVRLIMAFLGLPPLPWQDWARQLAVQIPATALLAPLMFAGLERLHACLWRLGWRPQREPR